MSVTTRNVPLRALWTFLSLLSELADTIALSRLTLPITAGTVDSLGNSNSAGLKLFLVFVNHGDEKSASGLMFPLARTEEGNDGIGAHLGFGVDLLLERACCLICFEIESGLGEERGGARSWVI